jgi:pimeloyl-ACP methyl ester carboxylesterase
MNHTDSNASLDGLNWESRGVEVPGEGRLFSEAAGPADGLPVLLVMGAMNPGLVWPPRFVRALVEGGCRVLRYDHRDTGRSFVSDLSRPYTLDDLAADALRVLDAWGLDRVAVVGWSMGGYIGQLLARDAPHRLSHLVLLGTSPDHRPYMAGLMARPAPADTDLPGPTPEFVENLWALSALAGQLSPEDAAVQGWAVFHGGAHPFPEQRVRAQMRQALANGHQPSAALRHAQAVALSPPRTVWLPQLRVPTLVLHGAHDPCLPLAHGEALAGAIPGAVLQVLDMGHILPDALEQHAASTVLRFIRPGTVASPSPTAPEK